MVKKRTISLFLSMLTVLFIASAMSCAEISKTWDKNGSSDVENTSSIEENNSLDEKNNSSTENETPLANNPLFEGNTTIEKITVYYLGKNAHIEKGENGKIGKLIDFDILYETETQNDVNRILAMFNGWNPGENIVPSNEILDLYYDIYICFGDELTMAYGGYGKENNYYGSIEYIPYYLPEKFGEFIDGLITK